MHETGLWRPPRWIRWPRPLRSRGGSPRSRRKPRRARGHRPERTGRRTGRGRYLPSRRSEASIARNWSTPRCSMSLMVCPSTPAAPAFAFTSRHALRRMSSRDTFSKSAWNRRAALAFAARYSARWSSRAVSLVWLALTGIHPRLPPPNTPTKCGPFPPTRFCCPRHPRYYGPLRLPLRSPPFRASSAYRVRRSQSTWRAGIPVRSHCWGGDGSLLFPRRLSHHSTSLTPPGSSGLHFQALHPFRGLRQIVPGSAPGCSLAGIPFRRGRLRFMLRTGELHLP